MKKTSKRKLVLGREIVKELTGDQAARLHDVVGGRPQTMVNCSGPNCSDYCTTIVTKV